MNAPNTSSHRLLALLSATIGLLSACAEPPVSSALDLYDCDGGTCLLAPQSSLVQGSVVYQGTRRGDAILFLFAANSLPPPDGTATAPVSVARVPSATLFGSAAAGSSGPFSAPYVFTQVPPGNYQIRAFLDITGDFDPFADFTQSPRAGAPTGGTVTFNAQGVPSLTDFAVASNSVTIEQVIIGQEVPFDPPAFQLAPGSTVAFPQNIDRPQTLVLQAFNPHVPSANFTEAKFTVQLNPSAAGLPQESDADGLLDVYPQITLLQTTTVQSDGSVVPVSGSAAAIVPCKVLPISLWPLLIAQPEGQFGLDQITVLIEPLAVQLNDQGIAVPLPGIPAGSYELVVAERTGQVWTLPNSLGSQDPTSPYYVASQATTISFTSVIAPGGAISGNVIYPSGRTPHNLIIQAFKGGPQLAPPLAAENPARVLSVPGRFIHLGTSNTFAYTLAGLSPGTYVVEALDDGDGNFNNIDILQTATRGDIQGGALDANGNLAVITIGSSTVAHDIVLVSAPGEDGQGNGTPLDPPAFIIDQTAGPAQIAQDARSTVRIEVQAQPDVFPALAQNAATTFFTVGLVRDGSGKPVDSDGDGLPDVWPRAFLLRIDPTDPQGLALASPNIAIPVAVDPTPFLPALLDPAAPPGLVLPTTRLSIIVRPSAVDLTNPAAPARLPAMPAGKYKLILMNKTGQLWQVPNSSGSAALDPRAAALVSTASQSVAFTVVPPASAVPEGEIDGTLTLAGVTSFVSAYIFAYSVNNPPPPLGTGTPVSVDFHQAAEFTAGVGGTRQVAYALRGLPGGNYLVTAIVDTRGDFAVDPQLFAAAPGPGDLVGGHVDTTTFQLTPVAVLAAPVTGITAVVSAAQPLPARPSFVLTNDGTPIASDITTLFPDALTPQRITLSAQTILNAQVVALDPENPTTGPAFFPVEYQGCAADGVHGSDSDFDNLPDLYPRVLVAKLLDSDPSGLTVDPADIVIPADVDPIPFLGALGACSSAAVVPATELSVILQPIAVQPQADGTLLQMPIPAGRYGIILESKSGQVWRIPNELQPSLLDPRAAATAEGQSLATQGISIRVLSQVPASRGGGIAGTVSLAGQTPTSVGNLTIAAYDAENPPPPLGTGRPVAVQIIPRPYVEAASGAALPYFLSNLPPSASAYLVLAINDVRDELSPSLDFMSTPPLGAQIAFVGGAVPQPIPVGTSVVEGQNIDLNAALPAIPFERPSFALGGQLTVSSSTANAFAVVQLTATQPDGLPYTPQGTAAFHPTLALNASGQPYRDPLSPPCSAAGVQPWASSMIFASPIDTGSPYVAYVQVNSCQFCPSLTNTPDCSAAPLVPPFGPLPMPGPITVVVTNVAIDPATKAPAGVALPVGHYAVTLIEETGQSWTVPNQLAETPDASGIGQATPFTVTP